PLQTAEALGNDLSVMILLEKISAKIIDIVSRTIRPDYSAVIVFADEENVEEGKIFSTGDKAFGNINTLQQSVTALWNSIGKHPIVLDEIEYEAQEGIYKNTPNI